MEPVEYFQRLKQTVKVNDPNQLSSQLEAVEQQLILAKKANQTALLHRLAFTYRTIGLEQAAIIQGYDRYVYRTDLLKFIEKVTPRNSVKLIELKRYPRPIPNVNLEAIIAAQEANIFDDFFVVFTDFTDNDYTTAEEQQLIQRNRDPIVFGWFRHEGTDIKHDRCYLITDWIDEYCDLDFTSLIERMAEHGMPNAEHRLVAGDFNLSPSQLANDVLDEMDKTSVQAARIAIQQAIVPSKPTVGVQIRNFIKSINPFK